MKTANLLLDQLDLAHLGDHADIGEKVVRKLRAGHDAADRRAAARPGHARVADPLAWRASSIAAPRSHLPPPGLHRLNRTEYANAIRDLLALEVDATKFLPPDDSTRGFDNIAGALTMSPALMEAYLSAAGKISRLAIGDVIAPSQAVFDVPPDTAQNHHIEGLPFGTRGGMLIKYQFPADGEYTFKVKGVTGYFQAVLGGVKGEQLEVTIDGERVKLFDWDKEIANTTGNGRSTPRIPVKAGLHTVGVTFLATNDLPGTRAEPAVPADDEHAGLDSRVPLLSARRPGVDRRAVRREGRDRHARAAARSSCAARRRRARGRRLRAHDRHRTLAKHAFRRPATAADVEDADGSSTRQARSEGGSFDDGIEAALQRVLADPEFIYRGETRAGRPRGRQELSRQRPRRSPRGCRSSCGAASRTTS